MLILYLALAITATADYARFPDDQAMATINGYVDILVDWYGPGFESQDEWSGLCATGRAQSPIEIKDDLSNPQYKVVTESNSTFREIRFVNEPSDVYLQFNGKVDANWLYAGTLQQEINGITIEQILALVVFQAPAEHPLNGVRYPLGITLSYSGSLPTGAITIGYQVYVLVQEGASNPGLAQYIAQEPMDVSAFLPPNSILDDYYYYTGSFDVPPCIESIPWIVSSYVIEASAEQIAYFADMFVGDLSFSGGVGNVRAEQPLNERTLYHFVSGV